MQYVADQISFNVIFFFFFAQCILFDQDRIPEIYISVTRGSWLDKSAETTLFQINGKKKEIQTGQKQLKQS